jgi:peptide/nickel transport system permease protein
VAVEVSVQAPDLTVVDAPAVIAAPAADAVGNWRGAWRRLRRNRAAMVAAAVFVLILFASFPGATLWVHFVAHRGPNVQNLQGFIRSGGHRVAVVSADGTPIGPGLRGQYLLGADANGRDLFVRLLYGGRTSLTVGIASALLCTLLALILGIPAGYYGGLLDRSVSRLLDLIWSFPVYLLAIAISASLIVGGLDVGPIHISSSSLLIPILVIAVVYVPYIARPIRGEVLGLRRREFVEAAIAHGSGPVRVMTREILPNVAATTLVLFTLIIANNILTEAALSFLGVGVSVLTPSWGNIIQEGYSTMVTAPWQTLAPGIAIMLTAISLNVLGDGLRDALDPHGARGGGSR